MLDIRGDKVPVNPGMIGPFDDGANIFYWAGTPLVAKFATLRVRIIDENEVWSPSS